MAHASRLPRTWLPAVFISVIVSACCAAALYVLLAQHDRSLVSQRNAAAIMAAEQSARAMARTVAWFSESLPGESLGTVQQTLEQHARQANLLDAAVITTDNMIVAASVQEEINGIINVCTGEPRSLADRVEQFLRDKNYKIKLDYGAFPDRPYDSPGTWGDATKIKQILAKDQL